MLFLQQTSALNSSILSKKYTVDQYQKGRDYVFIDILLDSIQKMTGPAHREDKNDDGDE
jgi:hypothetical protein